MRGIAHAHRRTVLWRAALVHRLSGIGLAVFLPLHFLVLGLALQGAAHMEGFLHLAQLPLFKLGETALMLLLVVHLLGGLRLLALETLPWIDGQVRLAVAATTVAGIVACGFLLWVL